MNGEVVTEKPAFSWTDVASVAIVVSASAVLLAKSSLSPWLRGSQAWVAMVSVGGLVGLRAAAVCAVYLFISRCGPK